MSELLVLKEIFDKASLSEFSTESIIKLLEDPELEPYLSGLGSIKEIIFRLSQQGIMKAYVIGDSVKVEMVNEESEIHKRVRRLYDTFSNSLSIEEFVKNIHESLFQAGPITPYGRGRDGGCRVFS